MNIRRKLERLEGRKRAELCRRCRGLGGRRFLVEWPGEPVDLERDTGCPACGKCVPADQVKVIDISGVLNLGLNEEKLEVARWRITGYLRPSTLADRAFAALQAQARARAGVGP